MQFIRRVLRYTLSQCHWSRRLIDTLSMRNYLEKTGWLLSRKRRMSLDCDGSPIPWYTYSFFQFISPRIHSDLSVFEYGSGNSTIWWADRVSSIAACEHNLEWYELTSPRLPEGVVYKFCPLEPEGKYSEMCGALGMKYDCIIIDGRNRIQCAKHAIDCLKDAGVIIWDNSDRPEYQEGYDLLRSAGFKRLDFWGLGPINPYEWCTSVFYRERNCLGI